MGQQSGRNNWGSGSARSQVSLWAFIQLVYLHKQHSERGSIETQPMFPTKVTYPERFVSKGGFELLIVHCIIHYATQAFCRARSPAFLGLGSRSWRSLWALSLKNLGMISFITPEQWPQGASRGIAMVMTLIIFRFSHKMAVSVKLFLPEKGSNWRHFDLFSHWQSCPLFSELRAEAACLF